MIALACLLVVLNSMQFVHSQLSLNLSRAQQSLSQQWSFEDLSQRLIIFLPLLKQQLSQNQQVTYENIKQLKQQCTHDCELLDGLFEQVDEWQLGVTNNYYFINQSVSWTLKNNNSKLLLKLIVSDSNANIIESFDLEI